MANRIAVPLLVIVWIVLLGGCGSRYRLAADWTSERQVCARDQSFALAKMLGRLPGPHELILSFLGEPDRVEYQRRVSLNEYGHEMRNGNRKVNKRFCKKTYHRRVWH